MWHTGMHAIGIAIAPRQPARPTIGAQHPTLGDTHVDVRGPHAMQPTQTAAPRRENRSRISVGEGGAAVGCSLGNGYPGVSTISEQSSYKPQRKNVNGGKMLRSKKIVDKRKFIDDDDDDNNKI